MSTIKDPREHRRKLNKNQSEYWSKIGVTQSGGSRYESGRRIPTPTAILLELIYLTPREALKKLAMLRDTTLEELTKGCK